MNILIAAATQHEILSPADLQNFAKHNIQICYTGVGMMATAVALLNKINTIKPDLIIQVGIAGSFNINEELGKVYCINKEQYGDLGVWENDSWKDVYEMELSDGKNEFVNKYLPKYNVTSLAEVNAITVNAVTTDKKMIEVLQQKYTPVIETMEGIALHYVCLQNEIPFIQIRAVSNYVGERDKTKWQMKASIENVNAALTDYLEKLENK